MIEHIFNYLSRPSINRKGFAETCGFETQYFDIIKKRNSLSPAKKAQIINGLNSEIEAAQNLKSLLETH